MCNDQSFCIWVNLVCELSYSNQVSDDDHPYTINHSPFAFIHLDEGTTSQSRTIEVLNTACDLSSQSIYVDEILKFRHTSRITSKQKVHNLAESMIFCSWRSLNIKMSMEWKRKLQYSFDVTFTRYPTKMVLKAFSLRTSISFHLIMATMSWSSHMNTDLRYLTALLGNDKTS